MPIKGVHVPACQVTCNVKQKDVLERDARGVGSTDGDGEEGAACEQDLRISLLQLVGDFGRDRARVDWGDNARQTVGGPHGWNSVNLCRRDVISACSGRSIMICDG